MSSVRRSWTSLAVMFIFLSPNVAVADEACLALGGIVYQVVRTTPRASL
jgi:hypothetical protein